MKSSARRAQRLLRVARRGPWGNGRNALTNAMKPVHDDNGEIMHYRLDADPWYSPRYGTWKPGTSWKTKAGQQWLRETRKAAQWDVGHALSDCCGWGKGEAYHDPFVFFCGIVPPRHGRKEENADQA